MAFPRLGSHDPTGISEDDGNAQKLREENGEEKKHRRFLKVCTNLLMHHRVIIIKSKRKEKWK